MKKNSKKSMNEENLIRGNTKDAIRDFFNIGKVKKIFRVGSDLFTAVQPFAEDPTPINALKSVLYAGKVIVDNTEVWVDDYFDESWESPYPAEFNKIILGAISKNPFELIRTSDESIVIQKYHLGKEVRVACVVNSKNGFVDRICVPIDQVDQAKEKIKSALWDQMKDDNIVIRKKKSNSYNYDHDLIALEVDDDFRSISSKRSKEYSEYLKKCIDSGVSRSVLLYGPPGTGKSTMARTIISSLGLRSFRIRVEDVGHIDTSSLFEAINIFEPDSVIIDDFDRSGDQIALLEVLEHFQRHVKLVIATVNNRNKLDEAILRPGRFDELIQVKQMDDDVVQSVLGKENEHVFDTVKDWPIAFIQEYVKRLKFMSPEEAEESIKELAQRVQRLSSYEDSDEDEIERIFAKKNSSPRAKKA